MWQPNLKLLILSIIYFLEITSVTPQTPTSVTTSCDITCPNNITRLSPCLPDARLQEVLLGVSNRYVCHQSKDCYGGTSTETVPVQQKPFNIIFSQTIAFKLAEQVFNPNQHYWQMFKITSEQFRTCANIFSNNNATFDNVTTASPIFFNSTLHNPGVHYFAFSNLLACNFGLRIQVTVKQNDCMSATATEGLGKVCSEKGKCIAAANDSVATCQCCRGYGGSHCSEYDACITNPCLNAGNCTDIIAGHGANYSCNCTPFYTGKRCEVKIDYCSSSPCLNNGTCLNNVLQGNYSCLCKAGFTGRDCGVNINECLNNNCSSNATCVDKVNGFECVCQGNWTGKYCNVDINECNSISCQNGAACINTPGSFYCECPLNTTGRLCEVDLYDDCSPNPCLNKGTCVDLVGGFRCQCLPGFNGTNCGIDINECLSNPCSTQGTSQCLDGPGNYTCVCRSHYTGRRCEQLFDYCASNPCLNNGLCVNLYGSYECVCPAGYRGNHCQEVLNKCSFGPCKNNATCIRVGDYLNNYTCNCTSGWAGRNCTEDFNECASNPCLNNAQCINLFNAFSCVCDIGWTGTRCESNINACDSSPCKNGANCTDLITNLDYRCTCAHGFTGENCSLNIDDCVRLNANCNNGECIDQLGSYYCNCSAGWYGQYCDTNRDLCARKYCQNSAVCENVNTTVGYTCTCPIGWTGFNCSVNINDCAGNPCQNGGQCNDYVNFYNCTCPPGFNGRHCEFDINECQSRPCHNNATCVDQIGRYNCICVTGYSGTNCEAHMCDVLRPCQNNATCLQVPNGYSCQCSAGYTGQNCSQDVNECALSPCLNAGVCQNQPGSFNCICPSNYTGQRCEIFLDFCSPNPCSVGNCSNDYTQGTFNCSCPAAFSGRQCQVHVCDVNNPCRNGATCVRNVGGATCQCVPGYTGQNCSYDILECASNPCQNNGHCIEGVNSYTCGCPVEFTGSRCETPVNYCTGNPCKNSGTCVNDYAGRTYKCVCPTYATGRNCEVYLGPCFYNPCMNNGTCAETAGYSYTCSCKFGYNGTRCEDITCGCLNGGRCVDYGDRVQCLCQNGFGGTLCEAYYGDCRNNASLKCFSDSDCLPSVYGYTCKCRSHLSGSRTCGRISECNPCLNNAGCTLVGLSLTCNCLPGYTGQFCQFDVNECLNNPCQNGGKCREVGVNGFRCYCPVGYYGYLCQNQTMVSSVSSSTVPSYSASRHITASDRWLSPTMTDATGQASTSLGSTARQTLSAPPFTSLLSVFTSSRAASTSIYSESTSIYSESTSIYSESTSMHSTSTSIYSASTSKYSAYTSMHPASASIYPASTSIYSASTSMHSASTSTYSASASIYSASTSIYSSFNSMFSASTSMHPASVVLVSSTSSSYSMSTGRFVTQGKSITVVSTSRSSTIAYAASATQQSTTSTKPEVTTSLYSSRDIVDKSTVLATSKLSSTSPSSSTLSTASSFISSSLSSFSTPINGQTYSGISSRFSTYSTTDRQTLAILSPSGISVVTSASSPVRLVMSSANSSAPYAAGSVSRSEVSSAPRSPSFHTELSSKTTSDYQITSIGSRSATIALTITPSSSLLPASHATTWTSVGAKLLSSTLGSLIYPDSTLAKSSTITANAASTTTSGTSYAGLPKLTTMLNTSHPATTSESSLGRYFSSSSGITDTRKSVYSSIRPATSTEQMPILTSYHSSSSATKLTPATGLSSVQTSPVRSNTSSRTSRLESTSLRDSITTTSKLTASFYHVGSISDVKSEKFTSTATTSLVLSFHKSQVNSAFQDTTMVESSLVNSSAYKLASVTSSFSYNRTTFLHDYSTARTPTRTEHSIVVTSIAATTSSFAVSSTASSIVYDPCSPNPCMRGAACSITTFPNFRCACPIGYGGTVCERLECQCQNKGRCVRDNTAEPYRCLCQVGFNGTLCETQAGDCRTNNCSGHGQCDLRLEGYVCNCQAGYYGEQCQNYSNICIQNMCGRGICVLNGNATGGGFTCVCPQGYQGRFCEFDHNECAINLCQNGGTCREDAINSYTCYCPSWSNGTNCEFLLATAMLTSTRSPVASGHLYTSPQLSLTTIYTTKLSTTSSYTTAHASSTVKSFAKSTRIIKGSSLTYSALTDSTISLLPTSRFASSTVLRHDSSTVSGIDSSTVSSLDSSAVSKLNSSSVTILYSSMPEGTTLHRTSTLASHTLIQSPTYSRTPTSVLETSTPGSSKTLPSSAPPTQATLAVSSLAVSSVVSARIDQSNLVQSSTVATAMYSSTLETQRKSASTMVFPSATSPFYSPLSSARVSSPARVSSSLAQAESLSMMSSELIQATVSSTYSPLPSPQSSIIPTAVPLRNLTCADNVCNGYPCYNESINGLKFRCSCPYPTFDPRCIQGITIHFPLFNGHSYASYAAIPFLNVINTIVMTFRATSTNGLLLYAGHQTYKDFILLRVIDGFLEFRFEAGAEVISIRSQTAVNTGSLVTLVAKHDSRSGTGTLTVNSDAAISKSTTRPFKSIQLSTSWYLGGAPSTFAPVNASNSVPTFIGFIGCIKDLQVNNRPYQLLSAQSWHSIGECDVAACQRGPCKNQATCTQDPANSHQYTCQCSTGYQGKDCTERRAHCQGDPCHGGTCVWIPTGYTCLCQYGRHGATCLDSINITAPTFNQVYNYSSYIEYPWRLTMKNAAARFEIRMQFKLNENDPRSHQNGILVFAAQSTIGATGDDFFALGLINNHTYLLYDLGGGLTTIRSTKPIDSTRTWHLVIAGRTAGSGYMYVDNQPVVRANSPGVLIGLDAYTPLYIGGVPDLSKLPGIVRAYFYSGFIGVLYDASFRTSGTGFIPLLTNASGVSTSSGGQGIAVERGLNIGDNNVNDCQPNPCKNNATCSQTGGQFQCTCLTSWTGILCQDKQVPCIDYNPCSAGSICRSETTGIVCDCPLGKTGTYCDQAVNVTEPYFKKNSFMGFTRPSVKYFTKVTMRFKSAQLNGLLFYVSERLDSSNGDFFAISLWQGFVYVRFDLGLGMTTMRSRNQIVVNQWHGLYVERRYKEAIMRLDSNQLIGCRGSGAYTQLNVGSVIYLGGLPMLSALNPAAVKDVASQRDFEGCVSHFMVNDVIKVQNKAAAMIGRNIDDCSSACILNQCKNDAVCSPVVTNPQYAYSCACALGWQGHLCDQAMPPYTRARFSGNGYIFHQESITSPQVINYVEMVFNTTSDGLLLWFGQLRSTRTDYLAFGIKNKMPRVSFNTGNGVNEIIMNQNITGGQQHKVIIRRDGAARSILFIINGFFPITRLLTGTDQLLDNNGHIYIGGLNGNVKTLTSGEYDNGLNGCVWDVRLIPNGQFLDLNKNAANKGLNVKSCG
eukprot:gene11918-13152_t